VGEAADLLTGEFEISHAIWHREGGGTFDATVKIRSAHPGVGATVIPGEKNTARVRLHVPQKAVTPGQAAVFYDGDRVVGGGWILRQQAHQPAVA
jgi:tRNA-specific 2-thiouridylase